MAPATEAASTVSLWHDTVEASVPARPAVTGELAADVAIVGGGLTGLWTAYYLLQARPGLSVRVLEREQVGFGASGRNGGWCSALFPASASALERRHGRSAAIAMRQAMLDTVDEVGRVVEAEGIRCDFVKGGTLSFVRGRAQAKRAEAELAEAAEYGVDRLELVPHRGATRAIRAVHDPATARLHPMKLVRGLAERVERLGGVIHEGTEALEWQPGLVRTAEGSVAADQIVIGLEGYRARVPQTERDALPLYSLMIATEPLPDAFWDEIGIEHGHTFGDFRHLLVYGQRTADNRFAFGGRGARYHWGSRIDPAFDRDDRVFRHLRHALEDLFPAVKGAEITHRWGGPLGVPRDWHASVRFDRDSRIATAGGYVGDGVSTTNIAGRTLAALLTDAEDPLTRLPWVDHRSPRWEPEPWRFIGANGGLVATALADAEERLTGRPSLIARAIAPLTGG
ncbi:FAD-binding oxidoreductase [Klugiella sp. YN-L-19]|uniref:FAD-binding oxidoreductase n=1 Tax=Ruicaihuangia caeni TaxID=3042517 RepID=A0AAW6T539_9MICO|nr:FAD-binding oxidoreductase [Klugiella sp. YN-L-19]